MKAGQQDEVRAKIQTGGSREGVQNTTQASPLINIRFQALQTFAQ